MTVSAVPPAVVAEAAAAAKAWLRAPSGDGDDDAAIATLAASAIELAEAFCGRILVARAAEETIAAEGGWQALAAAPVTAIDAVAALAPDGTATALASDGYAIDIDAEGIGWVRLTSPLATGRLLVGYLAGAAAGWDDLPPPITQGVAMLVAHLFDHRDGDQAPPAAVAALWRPWRRMTIARERHP